MTDVHSELMGLLQRAPYIGCADTDRQYAVNWLMNNGVTVQRWIPVTERLPEECGFYICFFRPLYGNGFRVGQCHWNEESWVRIGVTPPHVIVTHWMPMPQPPKGE